MSDDPYDRHRYHNADTFGIQSTAGAVPIKNKKGETSMQKVKVQRYVSGKRPSYMAAGGGGHHSDSEDEDDFTTAGPSSRMAGRTGRRGYDEDFKIEMIKEEAEEEDEENDQKPVDDPRLRRLAARKARGAEDDDDDGDEKDEEEDEDRARRGRHRRIHEPEILSNGEDDSDSSDDARPGRSGAGGGGGDDDDDDEEGGTQRMDLDSDDSSSGDDDLDEEGIQRRRDLMRQRALARAQIGVGQEEILAKEDEKSASEDEEETSSEEETSDSEEEEGARLKPVFVRKKDRLTVQEREREEAKQREQEREAARAAEARRRETLRMVESTVKAEAVERKTKDNDPQGLHEVNTDDEGNEEAEYEGWKLRELKRMKRDREEREAREREEQELERIRNMTEDERRLHLKNNPKQITNKAAKGKYKFMQKYYHRGAFFLDKEETVFKRDASGATLEDKFDKTVLPKVMQVKNFGRSGRTKYTHLVDQDTTQFDAAWSQETAQNLKFQLNHSGGMKAQFERPSTKKKK